MRFCELKEKEVVNICNGKCLGGVVDLQINECSGAIEALIVPGPGKFCDTICMYKEDWTGYYSCGN